MRKRAKKAVRTLLIAMALSSLAVPLVAVVISGTASTDLKWTTLRLAALYAFTLLFLNVLSGAARPLFNLVFPPRAFRFSRHHRDGGSVAGFGARRTGDGHWARRI